MSTPMHETPEHLLIPVDAEGNGPAPPDQAVREACWCGVDGCNGSGTRLYCVPHAEEMYLSLAEAYEAQVEPWVDAHDLRPRQIEEWTVLPKRSALPHADWLIDAVLDMQADEFVNATHYEHAKAAAPLDLAEEFLAAWARVIAYERADKLVTTYTITWDDAGEPLADGQPIYGERPKT